MQSLSKNPLIATFQLSSTASLNLGLSQNVVLGNGIARSIFSSAVSGENPMYCYSLSVICDVVVVVGAQSL